MFCKSNVIVKQTPFNFRFFLNRFPVCFNVFVLLFLVTPWFHDFICISETFFDSSFKSDHKGLMLDGYNLIWSDHPSNTKRGGVCIYYKESLAVRLVDITSLLECLVCEVTIQNKKGYIAVGLLAKAVLNLNFSFLVLKTCSVAYFSQNPNLLLF